MRFLYWALSRGPATPAERWRRQRRLRALLRPLYRALWRGDVPLALAFWGFGVLLGGVYIFVVDLLASDPMAASYGGEHALTVAVAIGFAHYILSTVGIWRASGRAIERGKAASPETQPIFAYLSRSWVTLGLAVPLSGLLHLK